MPITDPVYDVYGGMVQVKTEQYNELVKAHNDAIARIAELEAERAELVKDRERLDWLEQFVKQGSMVDIAAFMDQYDHSLWEITITQANDCWPGNDIRQAIDAAREG